MFFLLFLLITFPLFGNDSLFQDLMTIEALKQEHRDLPYLLSGTHFNTPSARVGKAGDVTFSFHPHLTKIKLQIPYLELSFDNKISDLRANLKISLPKRKKEDFLPIFAIGLENILEEGIFQHGYFVGTQTFKKLNLETSLGFRRKHNKSFFGGFSWFPFYHLNNDKLKHIALSAEYDHAKWNFSIKGHLFPGWDVSLALKDKKIAFATTYSYNFGYTTGLFPKIYDTWSPPKENSNNYQRPEEVIIEELIPLLEKNKITLLKAYLSYTKKNEKTLTLHLYNQKYRNAKELQKRLVLILKASSLKDMTYVITNIEEGGVPLYQYTFPLELLRKTSSNFHLTFPMKPATSPPFQQTLLFSQNPPFSWILVPKTTLTFEKIKYAVGLQSGISGYLPYNIYYSLKTSFTAFSNLDTPKNKEPDNPSFLPNIRTDMSFNDYQKGVYLEHAFLQKNTYVKSSLYSKIAFGYFEKSYLGVSTELLYYPIHSSIAFGLEGAIVKKRNSKNLKITQKIRQFKDNKEPLEAFYNTFTGSQAFASLYYTFENKQIDLKLKCGKFLANDYGARFEAAYTFNSGFRISGWYTRTNGHDKVNSTTYYDKGISFSVPLDFFALESKKERFSYSISSYLRDVGLSIPAGKELYTPLKEGRYP